MQVFAYRRSRCVCNTKHSVFSTLNPPHFLSFYLILAASPQAINAISFLIYSISHLVLFLRIRSVLHVFSRHLLAYSYLSTTTYHLFLLLCRFESQFCNYLFHYSLFHCVRCLFLSMLFLSLCIYHFNTKSCDRLRIHSRDVCTCVCERKRTLTQAHHSLAYTAFQCVVPNSFYGLCVFVLRGS